jgi:acetoin utilization deacetylase AcuC-like enzyme
LTGLSEPSFALIRPPGHHASADSSWGFCYFNNMAIALDHLKRNRLIDKAYVLDFDLHFGDGNVNILQDKGYVSILNPESHNRKDYLAEVQEGLDQARVDIIGVSAGFDHHVQDWGGLLETDDYQAMGRMVLEASRRMGAGCFGILEGGYNHQVLGQNVRAFLRGLQGL